MNKKLLVGSLSLAIVGISCLAIGSKSTYKTIDNSNLDERMAVYIKNETGNYEKSNNIPTSGYILNEEKSTCNNNAKPTWNKSNKSLKISNLSNDNTSCYLYFDELEGITSSDIVADAKTETPDFSQIADTDERIYSVADPVYGGTSYYYRGAVTNNYVKFAGFCWRIIRFNGDGSVRLIYDGATCHTNGTSTTESLINTGLAYNTAYNDNAYVGYMKGINDTGASTSYEQAHANNYDSTIKAALDTWYDSNLKSYESYISETAGFCNDRKISSVSRSGYGTLGYGTNATAYAPTDRVFDSSWNWLTTQKPSLGCTNTTNDLFTPNNSNADNKGNKKLSRPIGLITMDEVIFAGGFGGKANSSYYLYNGNYYRTMSPYRMNADGYAHLFYVNNNGTLSADGNVDWTAPGVRPVINLRADTVFNGGTDGTIDNPYVAEGA